MSITAAIEGTVKMLETIFNQGGIVVHYDPNSREAYTTVKGAVPTLDDLARARAERAYYGKDFLDRSDRV